MAKHEEKKRARGGRTEPSEGKPMEDERTKELEAKEKEGHKRGGEVKGHHSKPRMDRRARGGRMTPKEPFSGADGENPSYARSHAPSRSEGMGKEVRPS